MQNVNKAKYGPHWRPEGEDAALDLLRYLRTLHKGNIERGSRSHHEQSAQSHAPFDGIDWPWAISGNYAEESVKVAGCSVLSVSLLCS